MSDGDALLKAILDAPGDDTPRLVFADWLQENGEGERAEFVRVQCEWVHANVNGVPIERLRWLSARERELFRWIDAPAQRTAQNYGRCWWELDGVLPDLDWEWAWSRGFIGALTVPVNDWLEYGAAIVASHPIEDVRLPAFSVEIEPPGTDHGWQLYYYHPGNEDSHFASSLGLETRAEMIERLLQDVRDLESEFA